MDTAKNTAKAAEMELRSDFSDMGAEYRLRYTGNEFAPEFANGDEVIFSTERRHKAGDIVALWLKPEATRNRPQVSVWRVENALGCFLPYTPHPESDVHPVLIVRSAVDGKTRAIRAEDALAVHPKVGVFYNDRPQFDAQENGEAA